jgi:hypothetical protein
LLEGKHRLLVFFEGSRVARPSDRVEGLRRRAAESRGSFNREGPALA